MIRIIRYYSVTLGIGNPPKPFQLDIDTGSDLTWVQCDAPCTGCTLVKNFLLKYELICLLEKKKQLLGSYHAFNFIFAASQQALQAC